MLEERRIIGVVLAMVVRAGAGHVEVDELYAQTVGSELDLTLGRGDDARDGFDVGVGRVGGSGSKHQGEGGKEGGDWVHCSKFFVLGSLFIVPGCWLSVPG